MFYSFFESLSLPEMIYFIEVAYGISGTILMLLFISFFVTYMCVDNDSIRNTILTILSLIFLCCGFIMLTLPSKNTLIGWMYIMEEENKIVIPQEVKRDLDKYLMCK